MIVDNVPITDATDFDQVALDALRGRGGSFPSDNGPVDWVYRAYKQLAGTPYADRLARGVATCLFAESEVREQALLFFITYPEAAGAERVTELAAATQPSGMENRLVEALGTRITAGDEDALLLGQLEALRPGNAGTVVAEVTDVAPEWVVARAEEITRLAPNAGATILIRLQQDVLAVARRIVPLCHADSRFELDISRFIDDPAIRDEILDLFRRTSPAKQTDEPPPATE